MRFEPFLQFGESRARLKDSTMSAAASPTAGVADGLSGEQIAFRLMQATEAAAAAANAASQAVSALSGGSSGSMQHGGENRAEWYKVLPKPQNFEPKDREQELSGFRDCSGAWSSTSLQWTATMQVI